MRTFASALSLSFWNLFPSLSSFSEIYLLLEWLIVAAVGFDDNDTAAAATGRLRALAVLHNAEFLVGDELEDVKAKKHDVLASLESIWQLVAK